MAKKGESFTGLDTKEYILTEDDLVIADSVKILALAGIMGGLSSGATSNTRRIFVESATFDPITVRKTSQRLGIRTDSSVRFEKGVDRTLPHLALARYTELLTHFVADVKAGKQTVISTEQKPTQLTVSLEKLSKKIGVAVDEKQVTEILTRLGFIVASIVLNNSVNSSNLVN